MTVEGTTIKSRIKNLLRSPSIKLRRNKPTNNKENLSNKVTLEKVLGITAPGNRALSCDPRSGLIAYPAGCVVVLLNPKKNKQHHILNSSRKTITTVSFSPDGKYVVTGESGHMPAVRVWDVAERTQVAELQEHKYGISCVAFSPNSKYIISVGYQHDMIVNVWAWKKNVVVAANKVSSKVTAVSFSDDSSYFVTAGNRHVKFWYLDHTKSSKVNATVPLLGRSGLLGELRNNFFSDVACGRGRKADSTFCITSSGLLCEFNEKRLLDKWVELRTSQATSLSVTEDLIFCGCADGTVRAFSPINLHFICTLPRPHCLGSDIASLVEASHLFSHKTDARFPDTVAVTYDPSNRWLSCVYNDHSLYVWDVRDLRKVGKVYSALYHSACVWSTEVYPEERGVDKPCLPPGSFLSCSSDNTIRLWNTDAHSTTLSRNVISNDLQKIIYMDNNTSGLLDTECVGTANTEKTPDTHTSDTRTGIRTMALSPDGQHLASGDRNGTLRIHELESMEEILNVQAHDSEILCLEYSKPETDMKLLATASRDRLIHVLDAEQDYSLLQTLDEHSSSITAVRFAANEGKVRMISCGADKSIYFRTAQKTNEGMEFTRTHHTVRKTTLYDMDIDPTRKYAAIGCQDRSIRIFNISNGKQKKLYKGSQGEDGTLIKVQTDPSGLYVATSCSDKNISIFDFYSGECVATMFGHSEVVTGMKFTNDCKHLITVSGDSCIFVWRLNPELTISMRQRLSDLKQNSKPPQKTPPQKPGSLSTRRDIHSAPPIVTMSSDSDKELEEEEGIEEEDEEDLISPYTVSGSSPGEETDTSDEKCNSRNSHSRDVKKEGSAGRRPQTDSSGTGPRPRRRWSRRMSSMDLMVKSMLDLRQLESFSLQEPSSSTTTPSLHPRRSQPAVPSREPLGLGSTTSLHIPPTAWGEERDGRWQKRPDFILLSPRSPEIDQEGPVLYPDGCEDTVSLAGSEYQVKELARVPLGRSEKEGQDKHSPDSACSVDDSSSRLSSPDRPPGEDSEPTEPLSVDGNSSELDMEELEGEETTVTPVPQTPDQEAFLKQHFGTLADLETIGSPSRAHQNCTDSVSISSKFLSQGSHSSSTGRSMFPFLPKSISTGDVKLASGVVRPLVSEVRPLMEQNQDQTKHPVCVSDQGHSVAHEGNLKVRIQTEIQPQKKGPEDRCPPEKVPPQALRCSPLKKKSPAVDPRRNASPVAKAAASHLASSGLRKAQSVHNLHTEDQSLSMGRPSKEVAPQPQPLAIERPSTLPNTPRRTLPIVPLHSPSSSSQQPPRDSVGSSAAAATATTPTRVGGNLRSRSYMSPTTSSMAKMSRSVSMGDSLDVPEACEDSGVSSEFRRSSASSTCSQAKPPPAASATPPPPVALVTSTTVTAAPSSSTTPQAAVVPTLITSVPANPAPSKSLQVKLTGSTRPQLSLDVTKPLPDKPSLASFSPNSKNPSRAPPASHTAAPAPLSTNVQLVAAMPTSTSTVEGPAQSSTTEQGYGPTVELPLQALAGSQLEPLRQGEVIQMENPVVESMLPAVAQNADVSLSVESCKAMASELQSTFKKVSSLYRMVNSVSAESNQEQGEMARVLSEAFDAVRAELNSLPEGRNSARVPESPLPLCMLGSQAEPGVGEERTLALLEQYSQLLLQAVEKRLDNKLT
ncbi:mitogen-activated protein kinase-binding protein 1 [Hypomesus transpacificus]|uniref:mitogen-activated protein kinase-binding protein 1 n=1 Tax=Hypomesus transpacificus TaxID=137520 RepID=UPI001F074F04|nr:mitogen-activated protein kinase-binding protein 1 [Hypomesus transpacificus]